MDFLDMFDDPWPEHYAEELQVPLGKRDLYWFTFNS
jgi:hypothetical protein